MADEKILKINEDFSSAWKKSALGSLKSFKITFGSSKKKKNLKKPTW